MMKIRQYNRRIFTEDIKPQIYHPAGFPVGEEYGSLVKISDPGKKPELKADQMTLFDYYELNLCVWNIKRLLSQKNNVAMTNPPYGGTSDAAAKLADLQCAVPIWGVKFVA